MGTFKVEVDFAGDFIVPLCLCIYGSHLCAYACVCMCQHPFLMHSSFVCSLVPWPGESYFSVFES